MSNIINSHHTALLPNMSLAFSGRKKKKKINNSLNYPEFVPIAKDIKTLVPVVNGVPVKSLLSPAATPTHLQQFTPEGLDYVRSVYTNELINRQQVNGNLVITQANSSSLVGSPASQEKFKRVVEKVRTWLTEEYIQGIGDAFFNQVRKLAKAQKKSLELLKQQNLSPKEKEKRTRLLLREQREIFTRAIRGLGQVDNAFSTLKNTTKMLFITQFVQLGVAPEKAPELLTRWLLSDFITNNGTVKKQQVEYMPITCLEVLLRPPEEADPPPYHDNNTNCPTLEDPGKTGSNKRKNKGKKNRDKTQSGDAADWWKTPNNGMPDYNPNSSYNNNNDK